MHRHGVFTAGEFCTAYGNLLNKMYKISSRSIHELTGDDKLWVYHFKRVIKIILLLKLKLLIKSRAPSYGTQKKRLLIITKINIFSCMKAQSF